MSTRATVRAWHDDEGWGVVDSPATPGGCWVHFSAVLADGSRRLREGDEVDVEVEPAEQDGYRFRAVAAWPAGPRPEPTREVVNGPSAGYRSTLTLTDADPEEPR